MRMNLAVAFAGAIVAASATPVTAQSYDANPTVNYTYGVGNGYNPANAVVSTKTTNGVTTGELAVRAHLANSVIPASSTGGTGIYTFALGQKVSFDYSFFGSALPDATVTLTNLDGSGTASFAAALIGSFQPNGALQNSEQLGFGFLNGGSVFGNLHFNNLVDSTYSINLMGGGQSVTAFAQLGKGFTAVNGAVPEPATWLMMILGLGTIGFAMRRRQKVSTQVSYAG